MTRAEYIAKHKHKLGGLVLDGMRLSDGPSRSMFHAKIIEYAEKVFGEAWDDARAEKPPEMNGQKPAGQAPAQPTGVKR